MTASAQETAGSAFPSGTTGTADAAADDPFGIRAWMSGAMPIHPLMAHPAALVAATAAVGLGVGSHIAGSLFGALQGAVETMRKSAAEASVEVAETVEEIVEELAEVEIATQAAVAAAVVVPMPVAKVVPVRTAPDAATKAADAPEKPVAKARPPRAPSKAAADLKRIGGIGPKLEQVLKGIGIADLATIAGWSAADAAAVDERLGLAGRVVKDDWIGQAKALTGR
ncbi:NADH:ubiquinone oxidoreductase [Ciceribacter sp. sgz301302]|uniref:NADH:ubiquinone oxidoreductase n=1 Tax=Ciceribacter sp. sgz301302 TaxID=3342379 RepID=UPI0035BA6241